VPNTMKMKLTLSGALNPDWPSPFPGFDVISHEYVGSPPLPNPPGAGYTWETTLGTIYPDNHGEAKLVCTLPAPSIYAVCDFHVELRMAQPGHLMQYASDGGDISFINHVPLKLPLNLRCGNTSGSGFVTLSDGAAANSLDMKVVLDGARPYRDYNVLLADDNTVVGTLSTDKQGDGKFERTLSWGAAGNYYFQIFLRLSGDPDDTLLQYDTSVLTIAVD
jgi:hypothetical protein